MPDAVIRQVLAVIKQVFAVFRQLFASFDSGGLQSIWPMKTKLFEQMYRTWQTPFDTQRYNHILPYELILSL